MRRYVWAFLVGVNLVIAVLVAVTYAQIQNGSLPSSYWPTPSPTPGQSPDELEVQDLYNTSILASTDHWYSWALIDEKSGMLFGSNNWTEPSYVMSMIKPWIAADYFNHNQSPDDWTLSQLATMIVDSNDQVAYEYFGGKESLDRLVVTCGLTDLVEREWSWSLTAMSARDAVRFGHCIHDGLATTKEWTAWIIDKMRHVQGEGDFGPRALFPDRTQVATKNGWFNWEGVWYINCLTMTDDWTMAILQQWPYSGGSLSAGIAEAEPICNSIASQVLKLS